MGLLLLVGGVARQQVAILNLHCHEELDSLVMLVIVAGDLGRLLDGLDWSLRLSLTLGKELVLAPIDQVRLSLRTGSIQIPPVLVCAGVNLN